MFSLGEFYVSTKLPLDLVVKIQNPMQQIKSLDQTDIFEMNVVNISVSEFYATWSLCRNTK